MTENNTPDSDTSTSSNQQTLDTPYLTPGTQVTDKTADNPSENPLRVLNPDKGRANNVTTNGTKICNYETNSGFPDTDAVVVATYESELDKAVNNWRDMLDDDFVQALSEFKKQWGVYPETYYFPRSRIEKTTSNQE
jgi:hypothetical protein